MKYRVVLHRFALEDLESAYEWVARNAPVTAAQWLDRFQDALLTLESFPQRQPLARENRKVDVELREFLFGKSGVFRVAHPAFRGVIPKCMSSTFAVFWGFP